jgi:CBS domain-containing protein
VRRRLSTLGEISRDLEEAGMRTSEVLRTKGQDVVTITGETEVRELLALLAQHGIGAVVVSQDGKSPDGIVSERDVVRAIAERGEAVLSEPVSAICSTEVSTVAPDTQVEALMRLMTDKRIRHVPVLVDGELQGIVSIGDVVKYRITELESERSALSDYIATAR